MLSFNQLHKLKMFQLNNFICIFEFLEDKQKHYLLMDF